MKRTGFAYFLTLAAVFVFSAAASAAPAPSAQAAPEPASPSPQNVKMEAVEIRGELENPDVFYIIPRRKADMDLGSLTFDYSKEIMAPVLPDRFEAEYGRDAKVK